MEETKIIIYLLDNERKEDQTFIHFFPIEDGKELYRERIDCVIDMILDVEFIKFIYPDAKIFDKYGEIEIK